MDIHSDKIELVKLILNIDNPELIEKFIQFFKNETSDFWNELSAKQKSDIALGIKQLDSGEGRDYNDFRNEIS